SIYPWLFLNAFLTLLAYPLIPLTERLFGFVSPITLTELSDMNRPLLRELALKAPGTLQHSLQVGNLAEAAARRIKANPLLVKVAALYHDIGKIENPGYFIENQSGENPHDDLSPQESARILIRHVTEGAKMARKAGLPPVLINFILTHHGKTRAEFFYRKFKEANTNLPTADDLEFRYPGPLPRTKEESILMLADSVEAACKSLEKPTQEELYALIDKIIDHKLSGGQLADSMLSFRELEECRIVFRQIMKSVHHVRVVYPEEEE
ncbi:MAG: HDIG domain-containing protein, partial [Bacteroidetes bacterium]